MRAFCVSIDLPGHLDWGGYLATASLLRQRGHEVLWASGPAVAATVEAAGVPFASLPTSGWRHDLPPLPPHLSPKDREAERRRRGLDVWLTPGTVSAAVEGLRDLAIQQQPDILLVEPFAAAGVVLAEQMGLPLVVVGRPALPPRKPAGPASPATGAITHLCDQAGVAGAFWDLTRGAPVSPFLHIDFFCRGWYGDLAEVADQTVFCGGRPSGTGSNHADMPESGRMVLVTLGSTFGDDEAFFRIAAGAVSAAGGVPLLAVGRRTPQLLSRLETSPPADALVCEWIDYPTVFPKLAAVIHHGGIATTHAALVHGLPQIIVPHAGDQMPQAGRVTRLGLGYGVQARQFTTAAASELVRRVLDDPSHRARATVLAREMHALGGAAAAANAVESTAGH